MLEKNLEKYFNFSEFRSGQKEIVESIISGKDVVALMPTGGGKSLCYQLPAVLSDKVTIIVSPLIALMKDQVDSLIARGISATFINSSIDQDEMKKRINEIQKGKTKILYIAPERFANQTFRNLIAKLDIFLFAVDEAHCVSEWGHDFRPDYLEIKEHIDALSSRPVIAAFTATATPEVKDDIIERLGLQNPHVFVRGFDRPNLKFFVENNLKEKQRGAEILRIIDSLDGSGIVYSLTRKNAEFIARFLSENGISATAYHAGLSAEKRIAIQDDFMENKFKVIVATIAFGMGVDKADIRYVIHAGMPGSLEGYYQEAGRAGRDGEAAYCILLHAKKDVSMHKFFLRMDKQLMLQQNKDEDEIRRILNIKYSKLEKIEEYATSTKCRRGLILEYFDDPERDREKGDCKGCDVCLKWKGGTEKKSDRTKKRVRNANEITGTVFETVSLYRQNYAPAKIAKIRSLGVSTIFNHLVDWYIAGGEFRIEEFLTKKEEEHILHAIESVGGYQKLGPLKSKLPTEISYEKIRMAIAKIQRGNI